MGAGLSMTSTMTRINTVFQEVFDDDELTVDRTTTAADVEGWDSLMHVTLIVNVEKVFGVRFSSAEVAALKNVGELVDIVEQRTSAR
jgi:acyl carrier protein